MGIIRTVEEMKECKESPVFVDVRTKDTNHISGRDAYRKGHIPGAVFLDMKTDLTGEKSFLPDIDALCKKLGEMGISHDTFLVIYDQGNQRAASKAWYVFDYLGHKKVYILDGGYPAWLQANEAATRMTPVYPATIYKPVIKEDAAKSIEEVKTALKKSDSILIDSRAPKRYRGIEEPKYKKAGHIPGAKNFHAKTILDTNGKWKESSQLKQNFQDLDEEKQIIVSCGSGNSACMNYVGLKEAGFKHVSLFSGGFGEWIEDDKNMVAKG